jgi:Domain of unknown function (DUF4357)
MSDSELNSAGFGRSIQIFLVDGSPSGLMIASIHGWTGSVLVSTQSTFGRLLKRQEIDRTGIYILSGPDPDDSLSMRTYIGEADNVRERIVQSAGIRGFWEQAVVITTSDEALTKGHVRYLEARMLELAKIAGRATLDNSQIPEPDRRRLPEADRANMESFLSNLRILLPVIGLDFLKVRPVTNPKERPVAQDNLHIAKFEIRHKSGAKAFAAEIDGEFLVLQGSEARKDTQNVGKGYSDLKMELIKHGVLSASDDLLMYKFLKPYAFSSPSAAASVVLDRNANGRTEWKVVGSKENYHEWQEANAKIVDN